MSHRLPSWLFALTALPLMVGACNIITGADDISTEDELGGDGDGDGGGTIIDGGGGAIIDGGGGASVHVGGAGTGASGAGSAGTGATGNTGTGGAGGPICGDAICDAGEECASCPTDCGACSPTCGNMTCEGAETCSNCADDCADGAGVATTTLDAEETAFLAIINEYRAQNGLGSLTACRSLNRAAQGHSEDMRDQNYFSHTGLNGSAPWDRSCDACFELGCGPSTAMAENIAAGKSGAAATFDQWKNSPGHDANMLGASFTIIGIGRATGGGQYGVYWTNVFGGNGEGSCN